MKLERAGFIVAGVLFTSVLAAAEVRVLRFSTIAEFNPPPCVPFVTWGSQTLFHNSTDVPQTVRFLGVSNGDPQPNPLNLSIPGHETVTVEGTSPLNWESGATPNSLGQPA